MLNQDRWLLPEGIEEVFPDEAARLEDLGRRVIDLFGCWGYRLVMPPLIDFLDSLLVGSGHELDFQTFKFTDPASGRLIGLRADMTPQVARIDARTARTNLPTRFCYTGSVLHTLSGHLEKTRNPLQVGAELFGHGGHAAAIEVIRLMLEMLDIAGIGDIHLDLGHVGIYRALARQAGMTAETEAGLFEILQRKDPADLDSYLMAAEVPATVGEMLAALLDLNGPVSVLAEARQRLIAGGEFMTLALAELSAIADNLHQHYPDLPIHFDLAELRGYHYHTGVVFAAFVPGQGREIARGGRYDDIGKVFGHARPAVGFSADLKTLARLVDDPAKARPAQSAIFAPAVADAELDDAIRALRAKGEVVIQALGGLSESAIGLNCGFELRKSNDQWQVVNLTVHAE
jgi:ATP phosphoribosyltransferase regulatory subunit